MAHLQKASTWISKVAGDICLGKVRIVSRIGLQMTPCVKVRIPKTNFSDYNIMFYQSFSDHWALDVQSRCKEGDVVLVRRLAHTQQVQTRMEYEVDRVLFEHGNFIHPITKKRTFKAKELAEEVEVRRSLVDEIFEEPLAETEKVPQSDERRRAIRLERLERKKAEWGERNAQRRRTKSE